MNEELYKSLIEKNGSDAQLTVAIEELSELAKELCKYKRYGNNIDHIAEEVADVEIMLEQLKYIFGFSDSVEQWKKGKLIKLRFKQRVR